MKSKVQQLLYECPVCGSRLDCRTVPFKEFKKASEKGGREFPPKAYCVGSGSDHCYSQQGYKKLEAYGTRKNSHPIWEMELIK